LQICNAARDRRNNDRRATDLASDHDTRGGSKMNIPCDDLNLVIGSRTQYALGRALERMGFRAAAEEAYLSSLMLDSQHRAAWDRLRRTREAADPSIAATEATLSADPAVAVRAARVF
jgi:hypothetical protein